MINMNQLMTILSFVGEWIVFTFSFLQAFLEFSEQDRFIKKLEVVHKKVPAWYWIVPPYKIYKEQQLIYRTLAEGIVTEEDYQETLGFMHRALAWIYISLGGIIAGAVSMYDLLEVFNIVLSPLKFWIVILGIVILSLAYVRYRVSNTRAVLFRKKFFRYKK